MPWRTFDSGRTIGQHGSADGEIVRDEEHEDGARITLERGGRIAPFTISCGIYGWMLHTRFFNSESQAQVEFDGMREALERILAIIPLTIDPAADTKSRAVTLSIAEFIERFP
jgi:hypothetical protein